VEADPISSGRAQGVQVEEDSLAAVTEDYDKSDAIIPMMMATLWAVEALDAKRADLVGRARAKI